MSLPVLKLRVSGYCCAMINEDDKLIYHGASALQSLPITWYRKVTPKYRKKDEQVNPSHVLGEPSDCDNTLQKLSRPCLRKSPRSIVNVMMGGEDDTYVGIDAKLSISDTEKGPAMEVTSTDTKEIEEILEAYNIEDYDTALDTIGNVKTVDGIDIEEEDVIQRTILLGQVDCAAPGGTFDFGNMLRVGSGNFDCGIKVYSSADDFQLIGGGKKVLLFDILKSCSLPKEEVVSYINALVQWDADRRALGEQVADDAIGEIYNAYHKLPKLCC